MNRFCVALVAFSLVASSAASQSLADAARKEAERRKAIKTPSKVYTDADLKRIAPATPPPQGAAPAAAQPPAAVPDQPVKEGAPKANEAQEPEKDEAWWRARITEARSKLERARLLSDAMQTRINSLTNDWAARDDPAQRAVLALDRARALGELQRLKDEIDAQTKAIADIEEEARQAGVPPGWLR